MHCITGQITSAPTLFSRFGPSDYWLFRDLKKMLRGTRLGSNEEVITEINAYFETKDKSFHTTGIENVSVEINVSLSMSKVEFWQRNVILILIDVSLK